MIWVVLCRQQKDNSKKMANLKHKEQVEKKKGAQMLEEARKREDNLSDGSQVLQVCYFGNQGLVDSLKTWVYDIYVFFPTSVCICNPFSARFPSNVLQDSLRQRDERIEELEDALRESVQITADREMVLAQQEANHAMLQKQVHLLASKLPFILSGFLFVCLFLLLWLINHTFAIG